jgi:hypothetical protein
MRNIAEYNFPAFDAARDGLRRMGWDVISPADMDRAAGFDPDALSEDHDWSTIPPDFNFSAAFERDIAAIQRADAIFLLQGWEKSKGARAEKAVAEWLGKTIMYQVEPAVSADPTSKPTNPKDIVGSNKLPLHLWPSTATALGCIGMLNGALKYGRSNFRAIGVRASIYYDAARRHLDAWFEGEECDPDDGVPHLSAALSCIAIIADAAAAGKLTDDRMTPGGYRAHVDALTGHVKRLKELHAGKAPKHYTIEDGAA